MKVFGRIFRVGAVPKKSSEIAKMAIRSMAFKSPIDMWQSYFTRLPPPGNQCELRNGGVILLSSNAHDVITVMVNFCRREYGRIGKDWVVIDVGGNVGVFSLYAAFCGVSKVLAFEPCREAYEVFEKNIAVNSLEDRVRVSRRAVASREGLEVFVPISSSPYNKLSEVEDDKEGLESVSTRSLESIVNELAGARVDLLKLDCEGAEYDILLNTKEDVLGKIDRVRMELHGSKHYTREDVVRFLQRNGFVLERKSGTIFWLKRPTVD